MSCQSTAKLTKTRISCLDGSGVCIYTDGSCLKNPGGPGGWAFLLEEKDKQWRVSGGCKETTNNRMELTAVIEALRFTSHNACQIYTDSQWMIKCATGEWKRKSNLDLWDFFDKVSKEKILCWTWTKGHNGDYYNEIVDKLARQEAQMISRR